MSFTALRRLSIFVYTFMMIAIICGNLMILKQMQDNSQLIHQRGQQTSNLVTKLHQLQKDLYRNWHKKDQPDHKLITPPQDTFNLITHSIKQLKTLLPDADNIQLELTLTQQNR